MGGGIEWGREFRGWVGGRGGIDKVCGEAESVLNCGKGGLKEGIAALKVGEGGFVGVEAGGLHGDERGEFSKRAGLKMGGEGQAF